MKTRHYLTLITAGLLAGPLSADVIRLYDFASNPGTTGFTNIKEGTNFGTTWGALIAALDDDAKAAMGTDGAFRIWSYESGSYSRADATIVLASGLNGGFRVSFKAYNQNYFWIDSGLRKVAVRGANPGIAWDQINASSANYQNMLEVFTDGTVGGAWNRDNATGTAQPRYVTDEGGGTATKVPLSAHVFDLVVNASSTETFTYVVHSTERTLDPLKYDMFIDGKLATPGGNPNGSNFETKSNFNNALGFGVISFTTATASHSETDFVIDQAYIRTGADVNDGSTPGPRPIDYLLATSYPWGGSYYYTGRLGTFWADGQTNWLWARGGWMYLMIADDVAFWLYHTDRGQWMYAPANSENYVYLFGSGWFYWTPEGEFLPL